jgi:hypothetical protein
MNLKGSRQKSSCWGGGGGGGPAMPKGKNLAEIWKPSFFQKTMYNETLGEKDRQRLQFFRKSMKIKFKKTYFLVRLL